MGIPVKISDELVKAAREVAEQANRSVTKQIEYWAELGQAVEHLVALPDLLTLKAYGSDRSNAQKHAAAQAALKRVVTTLARSEDRTAALRLIHRTGKPVYAAMADRVGRVVQVWPDGRRVVGRFVGKDFVADDAASL